MLTALTLILSLAAPILAVPCDTNFTISPFSDPKYCVDATYGTGFAYT